MKKAPNPDAYWRAQADLLAQQNSDLYTRVCMYHFNKWSGPSIGEGRKLAKELVASLTNLHNYAESTYLTAIKKAIKQREREMRQKATPS
jgi:hypothetical protein